MVVVSYLFILWVIELFKADVTLPWSLCSLFNTPASSIRGCCGNVAYSRFTSSSMYSTNFPHSPYFGIFVKGQRHLHRQRCCVHIILTVHVCLSFPYMMPYLFSQSSLYSLFQDDVTHMCYSCEKYTAPLWRTT